CAGCAGHRVVHGLWRGGDGGRASVIPGGTVGGCPGRDRGAAAGEPGCAGAVPSGMTTAPTAGTEKKNALGMSDLAAACAPYAELLGHLREGAVLDSVRSLLGWDQETMMPPAGADLRS